MDQAEKEESQSELKDFMTFIATSVECCQPFSPPFFKFLKRYARRVLTGKKDYL